MRDVARPKIAIFPWLDLPQPITVCGITWYPRTEAIARAGDHAAHIEAATSYFYDHYRTGDPSLGVPLKLRGLKPSVVFFEDGATDERIERATHVFCFATIFANSPYTYANATTFEHFFQNIGGEPWVSARRTRRMHGSLLNGALAQNLIETRPAWCGAYHAPHSAMLRALEAVVEREDAKPIVDALEALMLATQDADTTPATAERAHYARAAELLLHRPGQGRGSKRWSAQRDLSVELLEPMLSPLGNRDVDLYRIMEARYAASDSRNAFWHPDNANEAKYDFEKQLAVAPNLIAFHAAAALVVASIRNLDANALDDRLETYVPAIEEWIGDLRADDDRPPEEAGNIGMIWSTHFTRHRMKRALESSDIKNALAMLRDAANGAT